MDTDPVPQAAPLANASTPPDRMEKAAKRGIPTFVGGLGAVLLGLLGTFLFREWYSPDVRYEELPVYRTGEQAVAMLKLRNYGGGRAKDLSVTTAFHRPLLRPPASSSEATPVTTQNFKQGQTSAVVTVPRLEPGQEMYVIFALNDATGAGIAPRDGGYVQEALYEGGVGKSGAPILWKTLLNLVLPTVINFLVVMGFVYALKRRVAKVYRFSAKFAGRGGERGCG